MTPPKEPDGCVWSCGCGAGTRLSVRTFPTAAEAWERAGRHKARCFGGAVFEQTVYRVRRNSTGLYRGEQVPQLAVLA